MADVIELPNLVDGYVELVDYVVRHGRQASPRGIPVLELRDVTIVVRDTTQTLPLGVGRDVNRTIAALETLQLLSGRVRVDLLTATAPVFSTYLEDDGRFWGAYGDRVDSQLLTVIDRLRDDPESRQGVVTLWDRSLDQVADKRDYPCTVTLGFQLRDDLLHMSTVMRSNDVWLGTAYDVFVFTQVQWTIARCLGVAAGDYTHTVWNLHIYERDLPRAALLQPPNDPSPQLPVGLPDRRGRNEASFLVTARALLDRRLGWYDPTDEDVGWYHDWVGRAYARLEDEAT